MGTSAHPMANIKFHIRKRVDSAMNCLLLGA